MSDSRSNTFVFVIWSAARTLEAQLLAEIAKKFKIVRTFEVTWPRKHFTRNLAAFYGWKGRFCWWNKARKCGRGPFLAIVVEDADPVWSQVRDTSGHRLVCDKNIYALKSALRQLTGHSNRVHSSITPEETAHQLAVLESRESPIPFRPMLYDEQPEEQTLVHHRLWWLVVYRLSLQIQRLFRRASAKRGVIEKRLDCVNTLLAERT